MFIVKLDVSRATTPAYFSTMTPKLALIHSPFITILDLLNTNTLAYFVLPSRMKIQHWVQAFFVHCVITFAQNKHSSYLS
jgi:hypothetical protein